MPSPAAQYVDSILKELHERALDRTRDDSIHSARTILQYDIAHQRCTAYIERCQTLNHRTLSSTSQPRSPSSSSSPPCASVNSVVNAPNSSPQSDDAHLIELPPSASLKEIIIETLAPGPKSRADYQRAFNAAVQQNADLHAEHQAMRAELNVFRSERLGSITTEKREELLAMRYESNKRRREHQPIPFFIKDLTPDEITNLNNRTPNQPEIPNAGHPRTHDFDQPPANSTSPPASTIPPRPAIPPCPSVNSAVKESMPPSAPSVPSVVNDSLAPGFVRDDHGNILSPRAAARRADPNRYTFKPKKLTHPTPITRARPNSS